MTFARPEWLHALWALLLIPLLYLVRRPPRTTWVPHLFLWEKVRHRLGRTRPSRLAEILSVIVQTAILATALLVLAGPETKVESTLPRRVTFLVDTSTTMAARCTDGASRLDAAKAAIRREMDRLEADDVVDVVAFADDVRTLVAPTADRNLAAAKLAEVLPEVANVDTTELHEYLEIVKSARDRDLVILVTGGRMEPIDQGESTTPTIRQIVVGDRNDNAGIVSCLVSGETPRGFELEVAAVSNLAAPPRLSIEVAGADRRDLPFVPSEDGALRIRVAVECRVASTVRVAITPGGDAFAGDDALSFEWRPPPRAKVLVVADEVDMRLREALAAIDDVVDAAAAVIVAPSEWRRVPKTDVVILVGVRQDEKLPPGAYLLIDSWFPGLPLTATEKVPDVQIVRQAEAPVLLRGIDLRNLTIVRATGTRASSGLEVILEGSSGPLISCGEFDGRRFVHLAFDPTPVNSSLELLPAWPLLVLDSVVWLHGAQRRAFPPVCAAGGLLHALDVRRDRELGVTFSDGRVAPLEWVGPVAAWRLPRSIGGVEIGLGEGSEPVTLAHLDRSVSGFDRRIVGETSAPELSQRRTITADQSLAGRFLLVLLGLLLLESVTFALAWTR